jgi:hypothetical protein
MKKAHKHQTTTTITTKEINKRIDRYHSRREGGRKGKD